MRLYDFTYEIVGKNVTNLEKCADYFLKPTRYFFNGKKVEIYEFHKVWADRALIETLQAWRYEDAYPKNETPFTRSILKTMCMGCLFFLGLVPGMCLKAWVLYQQPDNRRTDMNASIQKMEPMGFLASPCQGSMHQQQQRKQKISDFLQTKFDFVNGGASKMRQCVTTNPQLPNEGTMVVLSDIKTVKWKKEGELKDFASFLQLVDCLGNLKELDLTEIKFELFNKELAGEQLWKGLQSIDPLIRVKDSDQSGNVREFRLSDSTSDSDSD